VVTAIVPARNEEESIERCVESLAEQAEIDEIIVVDDQSTDGTANVLAEMGQRVPKLRVLETGAPPNDRAEKDQRVTAGRLQDVSMEKNRAAADDALSDGRARKNSAATTGVLPGGWVGKNYAVAIGAEAPKGDWLLFTDADTYHYPGSTRRALADATEQSSGRAAAMVSYSPEQEMETWWERALIPYVYWKLAARYSFERVNDPSLPDAAANGQFLMIRRDVYNAVGGHATVKSDVLEDVALARLVKSSGYRIYFAPGTGIVRTRMYRTFGAMWEGWTKNLYRLMGGSAISMLVELRAAQAIVVGMLLGALIYYAARGEASPWVPTALLAGLLAVLHARYGAFLRRNLYPWWYIQYYMAGACLYRAALVASWWKTTHGSVTWKGRTYPQRTQ
jgi:glycosyltransferase involved in cell wall biosynthesis